MSIFNFFTSFHSALSDPKAYASFQKELNLKAVEQIFFNAFAGKKSFNAVVLPEDLGTSSSFSRGSKILRVRPIDLHDFILPEPCFFKGDPDKVKKIISLHPVAYPDTSYPYLGGNVETTEAIGYGHIIECFFKDGPQLAGRLRGITYRTKIVGTNKKGLDLSCISGGRSSSAADAINKGKTTPLGSNQS